MQTTIDDRRIGYDSHGQGVPLLLLHAFPLNRSMFEGQAAALSGAARIITMDAPGVGNSEPGSLSIDGLADLAAGLLDALQLRKAVVGGVSMGGYAALAFARRHGHRLNGLILANTKPTADDEQAKAGRQATAELAREKGAGAIAEQLLPKILGATALKRNRKLVERVRGMIESTPPETIAELSLAMANRSDSSDLLPRIGVPTLVIAGEEDALMPPSQTRQWAGQIPHATVIEIPGAGHLTNLEAPDRFNAAVRDFLEALSSR